MFTVYGLYEDDRLLYIGLTRQPHRREVALKNKYPTATFRPLVICGREYGSRLEIQLIKAWSPPKNRHPGGHPGRRATTKSSDETRAKLREVWKTRKPMTARTKVLISRSKKKYHRENWVMLSEEHKRKISEGVRRYWRLKAETL